MRRAASPPVVEGAPSPGPLPDPRASRSFTGLCARREGAERHKSRSPTTPRPLQDPGEVTAPFPIQRLHSPRRLRRPEVRSTPFAACPGSRGLSLPSALRAGQGRNVKQAGLRLRPARFLSAPRGKVRFGHCPTLSAPPCWKGPLFCSAPGSPPPPPAAQSFAGSGPTETSPSRPRRLGPAASPHAPRRIHSRRRPGQALHFLRRWGGGLTCAFRFLQPASLSGSGNAAPPGLLPHRGPFQRTGPYPEAIPEPSVGQAAH